MLPFLIVLISHPSKDLACHHGLVLPLLIVVVLVASLAIVLITVAVQKSAFVTDSLLAPSLGTVSVPGQGVPLLQSEWDSPQGVSPLQSEWDSPPRGPPLQSEWDSPQGRPLHQSEWDSLQGTPPLPNDNVLLRGILLHLDVNTHPVLRLVRIHLRDPRRGLLPIRLHLPEKKRKLKNRLCQPVRAMIDFILKSFPEATASPSHPS